ncbi:hypothetical protein [Nocardia brasiliensis]|uniref:hypothetical protein n=1 Tax=Nocardia brasiliensis TaxID=37326 RepID=UPI002455ADFB|nr:hypothetical protein [Nocardia brasiliensis]
MNSVARLEQIADQQTSATKRIRDQFVRIGQSALKASRDLAAQEWRRQRDRAGRQAAARKSVPTPNPADLMNHPELLAWSFSAGMTKTSASRPSNSRLMEPIPSGVRQTW